MKFDDLSSQSGKLKEEISSVDQKVSHILGEIQKHEAKYNRAKNQIQCRQIRFDKTAKYFNQSIKSASQPELNRKVQINHSHPPIMQNFTTPTPSSSECEAAGGTASGTCASSFGVCCVFRSAQVYSSSQARLTSISSVALPAERQ